MDSRNTHRFIPLILSIGIAIGLVIGDIYRNYFSNPNLSVISALSSKITDVLMLVNDHYVDEVNLSEIVEGTIPLLLSHLDPHSSYSSPEDVEQDMQNLEGHFCGIGIQFYVFNDTVNVIKVIPGGPCDGNNVEPGDRIVTVDSQEIAGVGLENDSIMKLLKGPAGTKVKLGITRHRSGKSQHIEITINRGEVPLKSVNAFYMIEPTKGYIRISSFANNTYSEFLYAMNQLDKEGMESVIIDLRGNLGGYLEAAVMMANEFLPKNRLIVYIEGRKTPREKFKTDGHGTYQDIPLVVLVDEYSASASEVFAGAMQDNDRAEIVGRRTFGKGLVQEPFKLRDGSLIRLTKARYYTPSGRCVQKPYKMGETAKEYEMDLINRETSGELFYADSIKTNGSVFKTRSGRNVYDGGGIIPDTFVPLDTIGFTTYYKEVASKGLLQEFAYYYTDCNREKLTKVRNINAYLRAEALFDQFVRYAERQGVARGRDTGASRSLITRVITIAIIDNLFGDTSSTMYRNEEDLTVKRALKLLQ